MSKVAIVFWSATGNTETMANCVAEGANGPFTYQWLIQTPDNEIPLKITEAFPWAEGQYTDTLSVAVDEKKLTSDYKFS